LYPEIFGQTKNIGYTPPTEWEGLWRICTVLSNDRPTATLLLLLIETGASSPVGIIWERRLEKMKLIFSRKGWDSTAGEKPNPIVDGQFVPLPIPKRVNRGGNLPLNVIYSPPPSSISLNNFVGSLPGYFHPDPWLYREMLKNTPNGWLPALGHTPSSSAERHLVNQNVKTGDIMLFFGWFREATFAQGKLIFQRGKPDLHVIFGYLQIGEKVKRNDFPALKKRIPGLSAHPHVMNTMGDDVLYVARPFLDIPGVPQNAIAGGGLFSKFRNRLILTDDENDNKKRSSWRLRGWASSDVFPQMSYLKKWKREQSDWTVENSLQGQEFVLQPNR
jgi:hypothetical protein